MSIGPFSSDSKSSQNFQDASGAGAQSNSKSTVANNGIASGSKSNFGFQPTIKAQDGSTVTVMGGVSEDTINGLIGQYVSSLNKITDGQANTTKTLTDKLAELLQQREAAQQQTEDKAAPGMTTFQKTLLIGGAVFLIYKLSRR